ncbi:cytochrome P450 [Linderina pennispora]|uniref:Cytochrome P450 n=1 Tax=Linderina pennispora TaxID=61395 RepID=A0A1Y1WB33_9FUNG|nr:cytochrome P450 [Linderina pennispora]ORX70749.1 cytochrome P450 [Linderina pennispora]
MFIIFNLLTGIFRSSALVQVFVAIKPIGYANIAFGAAAVYILSQVIYALFFSPLRNIPGPFLARLTDLRSKVFTFIGKAAHDAEGGYEKYGNIYVNGPNSVSVSSPGDCRTILSSHSFPKSEFYKSIEFLGVPNISSTRDPLFNQMRRRQIGPSFTPGYLSKMESKIVQHGILSLKTRWDAEITKAEQQQTDAIINICNDPLYATFDIVGALAFGREFNTLKNYDPTISQWIADTAKFSGLAMDIPGLFHFPFSLLVRRLRFQFVQLIRFSRDSIQHRVDLLAQGAEKPNDLLTAFLDAVDPVSKARMSRKEVLAEMVVTLFAGSDSSAHTLMWAIHLLMLYPECYKRAVDEVRSAFAKDHLIRYNEGRQSLPYLEAVLYESMRVRPVVSAQVPRVVPKGGITLQGHFIPEGSIVSANFAGVNHHKGTWKDPHRFMPERFLDNDEAKRNVFAFGTGVRICPGRHLAWIELVTILANALKDYDFKLPDDAAFGPDICDKHGVPKLMDMKYFFFAKPLNPNHDPRVVISKAK